MNDRHASPLDRAVSAVRNKDARSVNVPALVVFLMSKDMDKEVEVLRRRLDKEHVATLLPWTEVAQEELPNGPHLMKCMCAISRLDGKDVPSSSYPQYESMQAEWVVTAAKSYAEALPHGELLSEVRLEVSAPDEYVTSTLVASGARLHREQAHLPPRDFDGTSNAGDFNEALQAAIAAAKDALTTNYVTWRLSGVSGKNGGTVNQNELTVTISAEPPSR